MSPQAMRELSPGTQVHGRYLVDRVLGAGGFGVTYRVLDQRENLVCAMKEYMPLDAAYRSQGSQEVRPVSLEKQGSYEKFRQKFLDEAQTLYKFREHPNIVQVRHLFCENNTAYYVMEFVEGMDLARFLDRQGGRLSWPILRPIIAQVVSVLKLVHSSGMIHCDISPDNIFLVNRGQVKLLDFGAARNILRSSIKGGSFIVAKMGYAPVEQLQGREMGPWTDVYALGVTIYRCITGTLPPKSTDRLLTDAIRWPSQMGVSVPSRHWEDALKKAMSLRPEERHQSVLEFWKDLEGQDPAPRHQSLPMLRFTQGILAGKVTQVQDITYLGVDAAQCAIVYPRGTPGVSRVHLRLWLENGELMAMDMGSTYGTWLDGRKMAPGTSYRLHPGSTVYLGDGQVFQTEHS